MTKQSIKTEHRLSTLEANYQSIDDKVTEIKDNHLVHLAKDIKEIGAKVSATDDKVSAIDKKMAAWSGGVVVLVWLLERFLK